MAVVDLVLVTLGAAHLGTLGDRDDLVFTIAQRAFLILAFPGARGCSA